MRTAVLVTKMMEPLPFWGRTFFREPCAAVGVFILGV